MMTVSAALDEGAAYLSPCRPKTPRLDAEVLLAHVLGQTRTRLYAHAGQPLTEPALSSYRELLALRRRGVPVAYLVGYREFYSRRFAVTPAVLIPRPETELLVEQSLGVLRSAGLTRPRVLELGTGSGVIAVTLALEYPGAAVMATDIDAAALEVAAENARTLGARVSLGLGDLYQAVGDEGPFDLIVSNPPYLGTDQGPRPEENVVRNEPARALFGGADGLDIIRPLINGAPDYLAEGGYLILEMAPFQVERAEAIMLDRGFLESHILPDLAGLPRALVARWEA